MLEEDADNENSNTIINTQTFSTLILTEKELRAIFEAKCQDFKLTFQEKLFQRFLSRQSNYNSHKVLHLENSGLGPTAAQIVVESIYQHRNIVVVCYSNNYLKDYGARCFADLILATNSIISFDLSSNQMNDDGLSTIFTALFRNKSVYELNVGSKTNINRNSIGARSIKRLNEVLKQNKVLSELNLQMTELNSTNIKGLSTGLKANHTLSYLNLSNNNIQSKGAICVLKNILNSSIAELYLADNSIQDDTAPYIVSFLQTSKSIRKLDLSGNQFTFRTMESLAKTSSVNFVVEHLIFARNPIRGKGLTCFSPYLTHNEYIKQLNFNSCYIDCSGIVEFANSLKQNSSIRILEIQHNSLIDEGVSRLANAIKDHPSLEILDLEMNEFGDEGCQNLFRAICSKQSKISKLNLKNNMIHNGLMIQKALQNNPRIVFLDVSFNDIDYKAALEINRLIDNNLKLFKKGGNDLKCNQNNEHGLVPNDVEDELILTRKTIIAERKNIEKLTKEKEELEQCHIDTKEHKIQTMNDLEERSDELDYQIRKYADDCRDQRDEINQKSSIIESEILQKNGRLSRETETLKNEAKRLIDLDEKIESLKSRSSVVLLEVSQEYENAKMNYKQIMNDLIIKWNSLHFENGLVSNRDATVANTTRKTSRKIKKKKEKLDSSRGSVRRAARKGELNSGPSSPIASARTASSETSKKSKNSETDVENVIINGDQSILVEKEDDTFETQPSNTKVLSPE